MSDADCERCEQMLQPYLDRDLTDAEVQEAEGHLNRYIRTSAAERMPAGLMAKLAELRGPTAEGL
jgi:hypothetical protein